MPDHPAPHHDDVDDDDDDDVDHPAPHHDDVDEQSMKTGLNNEALLTDEQDLTAKVVE